MQLEQSFLIPVTVHDAWRVLLDIEQVASCMPGAVLDSVEAEEFTGRVKVKLGPMSLTYAGTASFIEKDEVAHRVVINAQGKDRRGNSTAAAVISAQLAPEGKATRVQVVTDLNITGRPAQFGRGALNDVADKLLGQFADQLTTRLTGSQDAIVTDGSATASTDDPTAETARQTASETDSGAPRAAKAQATGDPEPIDLMNIVGGSLVARFRWPAVAALAVVLLATTGAVLRRRRG